MPHVYCQLSDPAGCEGDDVGYGLALGMVASANIMDENDHESTRYEEEMQQQTEDDSSEDNGVNEVYFKPVICEHIVDKEEQAEACQLLFNALTRLASLNPAGDSDEYNGGGGLFNMFSLMAGMGQYSNGGAMDGFEADENNDVVIRFGGSNNLVENDDESEGVPEEERQAMLRRLDGILVVPPEYEILPSEDGQFDDAEDDGNDDELL
ncbi:hypothetical protein HJC23_008248 [Cyclotella cryptica]|uniref:Uncharacterized protein n=1 Tax=Cyclotella cryptica TaxID=29204 RepID=A0ABD3Q715_9STRA